MNNAPVAVLAVSVLFLAACDSQADMDSTNPSISTLPVEAIANPGQTTVSSMRSPETSTTSSSAPIAAPLPVSVVLIGAGDIAAASSHDQATADIINDYPDAVVFTTGDNAYPDGSADDFEEFYRQTWGGFKDRTRPAIGNHDARTPGASAYFAFFGDNAGTPGEGWYSYDLENWHVIVLNSECGADGLASCSSQSAWLADDLAANSQLCMLAYWHKPVFNSGRHVPGHTSFSDEWAQLDDAGVDLVLNGHDHNYQRYAPQNSEGEATEAGVRQFIVGSGGAKLYEQSTTAPNLEEFYRGYGVLKLELAKASYAWSFIPTEGSYSDEGRGSCSS